MLKHPQPRSANHSGRASAGPSLPSPLAASVLLSLPAAHSTAEVFCGHGTSSTGQGQQQPNHCLSWMDMKTSIQHLVQPLLGNSSHNGSKSKGKSDKAQVQGSGTSDRSSGSSSSDLPRSASSLAPDQDSDEDDGSSNGDDGSDGDGSRNTLAHTGNSSKGKSKGHSRHRLSLSLHRPSSSPSPAPATALATATATASSSLSSPSASPSPSESSPSAPAPAPAPSASASSTASVARLHRSDMPLFGHFPMLELPSLVVCAVCSKTILASSFLAHYQTQHSASSTSGPVSASPLSSSTLPLRPPRSWGTSNPLPPPPPPLLPPPPPPPSHPSNTSNSNSNNRRKRTLSESLQNHSDTRAEPPEPPEPPEPAAHQAKAARQDSETQHSSFPVTAATPSTHAPTQHTSSSSSSLPNSVSPTLATLPKATPHSGRRPYHPDLMCGVLLPGGHPCTRAITCKSHSIAAKRGVPGRSKDLELLIAEHIQRTSFPSKAGGIQITASSYSPSPIATREPVAVPSSASRSAPTANYTSYTYSEQDDGGSASSVHPAGIPSSTSTSAAAITPSQAPSLLSSAQPVHPTDYHSDPDDFIGSMLRSGGGGGGALGHYPLRSQSARKAPSTTPPLPSSSTNKSAVDIPQPSAAPAGSRSSKSMHSVYSNNVLNSLEKLSNSLTATDFSAAKAYKPKSSKTQSAPASSSSTRPASATLSSAATSPPLSADESHEPRSLSSLQKCGFTSGSQDEDEDRKTWLRRLRTRGSGKDASSTYSEHESSLDAFPLGDTGHSSKDGSARESSRKNGRFPDEGGDDDDTESDDGVEDGVAFESTSPHRTTTQKHIVHSSLSFPHALNLDSAHPAQPQHIVSTRMYDFPPLPRQQPPQQSQHAQQLLQQHTQPAMHFPGNEAALVRHQGSKAPSGPPGPPPSVSGSSSSLAAFTSEAKIPAPVAKRPRGRPRKTPEASASSSPYQTSPAKPYSTPLDMPVYLNPIYAVHSGGKRLDLPTANGATAAGASGAAYGFLFDASKPDKMKGITAHFHPPTSHADGAYSSSKGDHHPAKRG